MKLNAVEVTSTNLATTVKFYRLLGFEFPEFQPDEQHLDAVTEAGSARLMIDSAELAKSLIGEEPRPGNHSMFALEFDTPQEVDAAAQRVSEAGFTVHKQPWDAFWGQRYAVVKDPDGYVVDLYAAL